MFVHSGEEGMRWKESTRLNEREQDQKKNTREQIGEHCVFQATLVHTAIRQWQRRATVIPLWFIDFFEYIQLVVNRARDLLRCVSYYSALSLSHTLAHQLSCSQSISISFTYWHTYTYRMSRKLFLELKKTLCRLHIKDRTRKTICNIISVMCKSTWEHKESLELLVFSSLQNSLWYCKSLYNFLIHSCLSTVLFLFKHMCTIDWHFC